MILVDVFAFLTGSLPFLTHPSLRASRRRSNKFITDLFLLCVMLLLLFSFFLSNEISFFLAVLLGYTFCPDLE